MDLYKTNKKHSVILFFITLILLSISYSFNLNYKISFLTIICFFLISTIGVSHGALDNLKGYKLLKIYGIKQRYIFYLMYIILSLITIFFWFIFPLLTLSFIFICCLLSLWKRR